MSLSNRSPSSTSFLRKLRTGELIDSSRISTYPFIFVALYLCAFTLLFATADGRMDAFGKPIGTDFISFYAAGTLARDGRPTEVYDFASLHAAEQRIASEDGVDFYSFHYPPVFLLIVTPLSYISYLWSLLSWQLATLAAYLGTIHAVVRRWQAAALAAAFPAVFLNLGHGQNALLSTALIGGALLSLERRPILAGVLVGCLAYKPQMALLFPLVLIVQGRWRTIFSAAATVALLILASTLAFGTTTWLEFLNSTGLTRRVLLEEGLVGLYKTPSLFAALRGFDVPLQIAYAAQACLSLATAVTLAWLWRAPIATELKFAAFPLATLLASPFFLDYEFTILALTLAWLALHGMREGFLPYEKTFLAFVWLMPLLVRPLALAAHIPIGLLTTLGLFGVIVVHATSRPRRSEPATA